MRVWGPARIFTITYQHVSLGDGVGREQRGSESGRCVASASHLADAIDESLDDRRHDLIFG